MIQRVEGFRIVAAVVEDKTFDLRRINRGRIETLSTFCLAIAWSKRRIAMR